MDTYFLCLTQYENVGDLLINKMLIEEFCRYGHVYLDCPDAPNSFRKFLIENESVIDVNSQYGISFKKTNILKHLFFLKERRVSCYLQSPGPIIRRKGNKFKYLYLRMYHHLLNVFGVKFCRVGNCCSTLAARKEKINFNDTYETLVRSYSGERYLKSIGCSRIKYIPDLAFLLKDKISQTEKNKIAVLTFREVKTNKELFISWLGGVIEILKSAGYQIEFFYQVQRDELFVRDLYARFKSDVKLINDLIWYDSFDYYADKELVISNRLHSLLVGAVYGAIPFAYVDGSDLTLKIKDVYQSSFYNYDQLMTDLNNTEKLTCLVENSAEIQKHIGSDCQRNADLCHSTIKELISTIENNSKNGYCSKNHKDSIRN